MLAVTEWREETDPRSSHICPQGVRAASWPQAGPSLASARTSAAASDCLVSSTGYLVINPLQVRDTWKLNPLVSFFQNHMHNQIIGQFCLTAEVIVTVFVQGWCPVTNNSLLPVAARKNTSVVDPCAAMPLTSSQCSRSWQDPALTSKRDVNELKPIYFD